MFLLFIFKNVWISINPSNEQDKNPVCYLKEPRKVYNPFNSPACESAQWVEHVPGNQMAIGFDSHYLKTQKYFCVLIK